jgi:hypothetical protein
MGISRSFKKQSFLKAFVRFGKVWPAARAVRISRDAVYDWLRLDPAFRRDFEQAKRVHQSEETRKLSEHLDFFCRIVRPVVPLTVWPRIAAAVNLAVTNQQFKKADRSTVIVLSRKSARFLTSPQLRSMATLEIGVGNRMKQGKNGRAALT